MIAQTSGATRIKGEIGIMGVPRLGLGGGGDPRQIDGLLMVLFETAGLGRRALDLDPAGMGVRGGGGGPLFGRRLTARADAEGVPVKTESASDDQHDDDQSHRRDPEAERRQGPQDFARGHGKAFRSSSKCGPSRRDFQSPPQTMAVPCRAAAALKAAAIRG